MYEKNLGTKQKALRINLDPRIYGSFAEIGAGQETAAIFFKAGGASGTVAKTMSAYDMTFSDAIYGTETGGRYVVESRLMKMLNREYDLVEKRLSEKRGVDSQFFAFANTVVALNFQKTNEAHGWLGLQFQLTPFGPSNYVVIHVRMRDNENLLQQQALGIIGVNLLYGCFFYYRSPQTLLKSLMDDLTTDRIEIDMVRFSGPDFEKVDNRLMSLRLVRNGFTDAALFGADGGVLQPSEALYKKHILMMRGRLRPITNVHIDLIENGKKQFLAEPDVDESKVVLISELTLHNLKGSSRDIDEKDFLDRVDILCSLGHMVMISNYHEYYKLASFLSRLSKLKAGLLLGSPNLQDIFEEKHYEFLPGGILESFATLFSRKVKLFIYPTLQPDGSVYSCENFVVPEHLRPLFQYLILNDKIEDIRNYNKEHMHITTDSVLEMIKRGEPGWDKMVPDNVAAMIKEKSLFGLPNEDNYVDVVKQIHQAVGNL
ncbi:hypothetical protein CLV98_101234 [Dyadobacter jejuensis]|uniref:TonB-dependent receptor n=1 Tax=Dyadobacter jejuensis TaxID=1082580 RepID=A0A316ARC1_9BACT|nr:nicotinate-nucleotide adenylyltransferase [Dyadobacter jejuensis]PWJ60058.1 hypothetical protein CLV98_101234 [Dyadobacter jejuensis]